MNNLFFKDEGKFWEELLTSVVWVLFMAVLTLFPSIAYMKLIGSPGIFFMASNIILITLSICFLGFAELKAKSFKKVSYFWFFEIPILNMFTMLIYFIHLGYARFRATVYKYTQIYKECVDEEFENTLQSILDHSKRMNNKIQTMKNNCNTKTDKIILDIMEENQRTINILKS